MELHDIFRLNVPGYVARYPGVGLGDNRGYNAAEQLKADRNRYREVVIRIARGEGVA